MYFVRLQFTKSIAIFNHEIDDIRRPQFHCFLVITVFNIYISGLKKVMGPRNLLPNGEDAFGDKDVVVKYFCKTYEV